MDHFKQSSMSTVKRRITMYLVTAECKQHKKYSDYWNRMMLFNEPGDDAGNCMPQVSAFALKKKSTTRRVYEKQIEKTLRLKVKLIL
jgi:hypothetical protein